MPPDRPPHLAALRAAALAVLAFVIAVAPARAGTPIWMLAQSLRARSLGQVPRFAQPAPFGQPPGFGFAMSPLAPGPLPPAAAPALAASGLSPGAQCRAAIAATEREYRLPPRLLMAIGLVESGRRDPGGQFEPWPWSIDVEGTDHVYASKAEAIAAVRAFQAAGARSIDVGCLQVNLLYHPDAFASLDEAFDPLRNADYAARFLLQLRAQAGGWPMATAWYHSAAPELGMPYQRRVSAMLAGQFGPAALAGAGFDQGGLQIAAGDGQAAHVQNLDGQGAYGQAIPPAPTARAIQAGTAIGAYMLGNAPRAARLPPTPVGGVGRGLSTYRTMPVLIASRVALH